MSFRNKLIRGFGTALCILLLIGALSYQRFLQEDSDQKWVAHTQEVLEQLDAALAASTQLNDDERPFLTSPEGTRSVALNIAAGLEAEGDSRPLRVALQNLIGNAWKFTSKREKAQIEFGAQGVNGGKAYFVRDNGAGFEQSYSSRLFGAFQRLHAASEFPGTGIGLATVQRIIRRHGGTVWAEGAVNQGTTVYFTLGRPNT